jgi:hypothetical protein
LTFIANDNFAQRNENYQVKTIVIDPGHGGKDPGAVNKKVYEKDINLSVALKLGKHIEDNFKNVKVIYTRKTDVFIDLIERANIANRADATIFVSIHCNANRNTAASGTETYVMGMSKVASNLEAAKKENSVITLEKDYKEKHGLTDKQYDESLGIVYDRNNNNQSDIECFQDSDPSEEDPDINDPVYVMGLDPALAVKDSLGNVISYNGDIILTGKRSGMDFTGNNSSDNEPLKSIPFKIKNVNT